MRGILFNVLLMTTVLHPIRNYCRDWMHTLASNGVAGTHLALICGALKTCGVDIRVLQVYGKKFFLPRSRGGKVSDLFFKDHLVSTDHVRHFASDVLGMVQIMYAFLIDKIKPKGILQKNIDAFECLYDIMSILRHGDMNVLIHNRLTKLVDEHAALFLELYTEKYAKIKFHHLYDLADDLLYLQKCLSCFPGERKNKDALAVAVLKDRAIERSSTIAFLHQTISHWADNEFACSKYFLINPQMRLVDGMQVKTSIAANLPSGDVRAGEMVVLVDASIAKVVCFWERNNTFLVQLAIHRKMSIPLHFEVDAHAIMFQSVDDIVEPVTWYAGPSSIVAIVPRI
jgi:hypothetical protein